MLSEPRYSLGVARAGDKLIFAGGQNGLSPSDAIEIYDAATDSWSTATLSVPRAALSAATVGRLAVFAGGVDESLLGYDLVDVYDSSTDVWYTLTLSERRGYLTGASAGGVALFAGGLDVNPISGAVDLIRPATPRPFGVATTCPCANAGSAVAGCVNSTGSGASLTGGGCPSVSSNSLSFEAQGLVAEQPAVLYAGAPASSAMPLGDGQLWLTAPLLVDVTGADGQGTAAWQSELGALAQPGQELGFQVWYRDPHGPCGNGSNLSNGLRVVYEP